MKLNSILCSMAALTMMGSLVSCQNGEDVNLPEQPGIDLSNGQTVSFSIKMPVNELKTRAGQDPTLTYGDDGLYSFSRTIDKLWYAVYNNGTLLYNSTEAGIPQGVYDAESDTFSLDLQIPEINGSINLEDYKVFFFAGNASDKVATTEIADGIGLDFANKTMYAYPTLLNTSVASGDIYNPSQYDYFAKYVTLSDVVDATLVGTIVLTRPFCQVTLLTDEFSSAAVLKTFDSNGKVATTTTPTIHAQGGAKESSLAYGWNYDSDEILTKDAASLSLIINSKALNNADGSLTLPQEVTFKSRKMFCLASYLMLAPDTRKAYDASATANQFAFALNVVGDRYSTTANLAVNMPTGGLKANEKYIVYNKEYDPNDPENPGGGEDPDPDKPGGGDGGILSNHYLMDIVVDPAWSGNSEVLYK